MREILIFFIYFFFPGKMLIYPLEVVIKKETTGKPSAQTHTCVWPQVHSSRVFRLFGRGLQWTSGM